MFPVSVKQIREAENGALLSGVPEYALMCAAGCGAADFLMARYGLLCRYLIFCGGGNNGGDGLVTAAELFRRGARVEVWSAREKNKFAGCAAQAAQELPAEIPFFLLADEARNPLCPGDIAVDALLGIGFDGGALRPQIAKAVQWMNSAAVPVAAFDLPSGVAGDSGEISPDGVVNAEITITFGGVKTGLINLPGSLYRGALRVVDIGLHFADKLFETEVFTNLDAVKNIPRPAADRHKNSTAPVVVWGGCGQYPGAPQLAAQGALRAGAGIVRVITTASGTALNALIPVPPAERAGALAKSGVLVCGCGWGENVPPEFLSEALDFSGRLIVDADALNLAARRPDLWRQRPNVIITPHPGEAVRLAKGFGLEMPDSRVAQAKVLAQKTAAVTVLKGRDTIVAAPDGRSTLIAAGCAALATAGSGDTLAGIIAAFCAAGLDGFTAAALGAYVHGIAGEMLENGPCADDLPGAAGRAADAIRRNRLF